MHSPSTVRAGWVRYTGGQERQTWEPPVPLDVAREWAHNAAEDREIHAAQFTHLDGSTSGMYVADTPNPARRPHGHNPDLRNRRFNLHCFGR